MILVCSGRRASPDAPRTDARCGSNAGTGHAALMELNYTPQTANGINIDKAVDINEALSSLPPRWTSAQPW
jgi:hypothetical protein